ncbi:hypothetical protein G6F65_021298 [Rhizopus arrhizus]|nr:hypothetical protein G6F65_021298 [Rhizopus arrhizus]
MLGEPAIADGGAQYRGHRARADAREHAPGHEQVPGFGHVGADGAGGGHQHERPDQYAAQAETLHRGGGEGADQAIQEDADGRGKRDRTAAPAERFFKRHQQYAGRRAQPGRHQQRKENHRDHDKSVLLAGAPELEGGVGYTHVTDRYVFRFANSTYRSVTSSSTI